MNDSFQKHAVARFGEKGKEWLDAIPSKISEYEKTWHIRIFPPFELSYNYVAPGVREDGTEVVLKIGFPEDKEFFTEMNMLRVCNGEGIVKLFAFDEGKAVALIERCQPGKSLRALPEKEATSVVSSVMKKIWKPVPKDFPLPHIKDWGNGFARLRKKYNGTSGPIPKELFDKAEGIFTEFCDSPSEEVLLHGDLHHDNILSSTREDWLAIDPKGVIGEKAYETGIWLRNPWPDLITMPNVREILPSRIDQLAEELSLDKERILGWGFAQSVLSAIWVIEDRAQYVDYYLSCARMLSSISL